MSRNLEDEASFFLGEGRNAEVMATDVDRVEDVEGNPESDFALYGPSNLNRTDQGGLMKFLVWNFCGRTRIDRVRQLDPRFR